MVVNAGSLLELKPIKHMLGYKERANGVSHGLTEVGYDIRLKQTIEFSGSCAPRATVFRYGGGEPSHLGLGSFTLASAMEEFDMPETLVGIVHDKSTWARRGLSVFNTVIEPGWKGFLTLELVYHGYEKLLIEAGTGIAQVIFHEPLHSGRYTGKYQNQEDRPVAAIAG
jgi:dCTP deaminase